MASALSTAPCVRAVEVDYASRTAVIGTEPGKPVSKQELDDALRPTPYRVEVVKHTQMKGQ